MRYPEHWLPLWQSFATQSSMWRPDGESFLVFILLALWLERSLAFLGVQPRDRIIAAILLSFAAMVIPIVLWLAILGCGAVTLLWIASQRQSISLPRIIGLAGAAALLLILVLVYTNAQRSKSEYTNSGSGGLASVARVPESNVTDTAVITDTVAVNAPPPSKPSPERAAFAYQGLPAKFELPGGVRSGSFNEEMLSPDRPQTITLVLVSMTLVTWLTIAMTIFAAWMVWRNRSAIRENARQRIAQAMPVSGTPTPV
jgi:hypothetical protein